MKYKMAILIFVSCLLTLSLTIAGCGGSKDHKKVTSTPIGTSTPIIKVNHVAFEWVYQPDGSTNFETGVVKGTTTLTASDDKDPTSYNTAGFSFSEGIVVNIQAADIYFGDYNDFPTTFWANNGSGGIRDLGEVPLENVANAPLKSIGSGSLQYHNEQPVEIIKDHTYCVITRDATHYAKMRVTDLNP
jgi:hypothetical protein